ncbi:MAG: acyltransferase [Saprospiraceae bacterium]
MKNIFKNIIIQVYLVFLNIFKVFLGISFIVNLLETVRPLFIGAILSRFGATIGDKINFKGRYSFDNVFGDQDSKNDFSNLSIGNRCVIGKGVFFDLTNKIILENEVGIGANSMLMTHIDLSEMPMSKLYPRKSEPIRIGEGTFLGAHVVVIHGVTLGKCCVVAAGSVITQSFPEYSLIAGVPARLVRKIELK